jgi:hypothetical protein
MLDYLPKISIVTPSFNQSKFLEASIQSVLSQNYPNLEYIIIDGGSSDGSLEIIKKYESFLHYWCSEPDAGHYDALNKGFAKSSGEIMAWLNSDDMYCPWAFKTVSSIMSSLPEIRWLSSLQPMFWDWHGYCIGTNYVSGYSKQAFLDGCYTASCKYAVSSWIQQESTFWHRSLWEQVGSNLRTEYHLAADFDLWARFFNYADLFGVDCPLGGFRIQHNQRSNQGEAYASEAQTSLDAIRQLNNWSPDLLRTLSLKFAINKLPRLKILSKSMYAYTGKKVVRQDISLPSGSWYVEQYQFFKQSRLP